MQRVRKFPSCRVSRSGKFDIIVEVAVPSGAPDHYGSRDADGRLRHSIAKFVAEDGEEIYCFGKVSEESMDKVRSLIGV